MKAGMQRTLNKNLIRKNGLRVIPSAVIYGANASGKSNIIMSLVVMKDIILAGTLEASSPDLNNLELYPFAHSSIECPMEFEIEFIHKKFHVIYGFELSLTKFKKGNRKILTERLSIVDKEFNNIEIFKRNLDGVKIMKVKKTLDTIEFNEKLLVEFEKKINENLDDTELFLSRAFKSTISNDLAEVVIDFFREELVVVSDFTLKKTNLTFTFEDNLKKISLYGIKYSMVS